MDDRIYDIKVKLLAKIEDETKDMNRMDVEEVGILIDAIHHLAETEYYCSIADSMWAEKHMYGTGSSAPVSQARMGYTQADRMGYSSQTRNPTVENLRSEYQKASPDEREHLRREVMKMVGAV